MARLAAGVRKRKDGTLEKRFTVNGKRYSAYGKTSDEVNEKEQEIREKLKQGIYTDNRNITLDEYFKEWIDRKRGNVKGSTIWYYRSKYNHTISPYLGSRKIQQLERRELYSFRDEMLETTSPENVNQMFFIIKMILNEAMTDEIIVKNPANGIKTVKTTKIPASETIHRALTEEEQKLFMEAAKDTYYYEFIAFLLSTGMRIGEAAALSWDNIDLKNNEIHVLKNKTISEEGKASIGSPKTKTSVRDIPINDSIRKILIRQREKMKLLNGTKIISYDQQVFLSPTGILVSDHAVNYNIFKILEKLEKEGVHIDRFTAHALRDTFATRFIEQGGNPQTLKVILGHTSLAMTMDLYSHVMPNTKHKEMNLVKISI